MLSSIWAYDSTAIGMLEKHSEEKGGEKNQPVCTFSQ